MKEHLLRSAVAMCALLILSGAQATLVSSDLNDADDGLLTLDTDTNLYWLDLTETANLSANQILGDTGGWISQGFRYATRSEVTAMLLGSAGFTSLNDFLLIHEIPAQTVNALFNTDLLTCLSGTSCGLYIDGDGVDLLGVQASGVNSGAFQILDSQSLDWSTAEYGSMLVITVIPGDIDGDGSVTVSDLLLMEQAIIGAITLSPLQVSRADIYPGGGDGVLDIADLLTLQQMTLAP